MDNFINARGLPAIGDRADAGALVAAYEKSSPLDMPRPVAKSMDANGALTVMSSKVRAVQHARVQQFSTSCHSAQHFDIDPLRVERETFIRRRTRHQIGGAKMQTPINPPLQTSGSNLKV
eukprot:14994412-Heterocapsa_arctica.AAC.1